MIPYGKQTIDDDDIVAVVDALKSDYLTQGPKIEEFESAFASKVGAKHAVAVNSGTAALHACMHALGIGPGDEVIVPPITFTATANCVMFVAATTVFADVMPSGHIDPKQIEQKITKKTKAVIAVDYAGWPCDYAAIQSICDRNNLTLVCDACHALGASWNDKPVGSIGRLNCFSFHPVKHIATGEGGMVTTNDAALAEKIRDFRTHGITRDPRRFVGLGAAGPHLYTPPFLEECGPWYYEMQTLGYNYRMPDINAALGLSQLKKLDRFVARRREIANTYYERLVGIPHLELPISDLHPAPRIPHPASHSFHLFPVQINFSAIGKTRSHMMSELRSRGVGTQVHYIPVCRQPYYATRRVSHCPVADEFYSRALSLPMYPSMRNSDVQAVVQALSAVLER